MKFHSIVKNLLEEFQFQSQYIIDFFNCYLQDPDFIECCVHDVASLWSNNGVGTVKNQRLTPQHATSKYEPCKSIKRKIF